MLQEQTTSNSTSNDTDAFTSITYNVSGTCRECPVTRTGSFELFDDSFRRLLGNHLLGNDGDSDNNDDESSGGVRLRVRVRLLELFPNRPQNNNNNGLLNLNGREDNDNDDKSDCTCATGVQPLEGGQAPETPKLIEVINARLEKWKNDNDDSQPFRDMRLANILQLDDLSDIVSSNDTITNDEGVVEESASVQKTGGVR